jgi:hypothetical protein
MGFVGFRRVYRQADGSLYIDESNVFGASPSTEGANPMAIEYMDEMGLELVEDDLGAMDYISLGDEHDEMGAMDYISLGEEEDELGRRRRRRRRRRGRGRRRAPRRRAARRPAVVVQKTILVGSIKPGSAGAGSVTIRPQFDFVAEDLTFQGSTGSTNGVWTITSINFGDRIIFSNSTGVPLAVFAAGNFLRGLVKGAAIKAGLDIAVNADLSGAAVVKAELIATFTGLKRGTSGCMP